MKMSLPLSIGLLSFALTACLSTTPPQTGSQITAQPVNAATTTPNGQNEGIPYTKEQYQKLADAINRNKGEILKQLNDAANRELKGKTFTVPLESGTVQ